MAIEKEKVDMTKFKGEKVLAYITAFATPFTRFKGIPA
jgi:hypothetical protein